MLSIKLNYLYYRIQFFQIQDLKKLYHVRFIVSFSVSAENKLALEQNKLTE